MHPFPGTDPSFVSEVEMSQEMDLEMGAPGAYSEPAQLQHNSLGPTFYFDQEPFSPLEFPEQPPPLNINYSHQRHLSSSTQSTQVSAYRSSNGSTFSHWDPRSSVASTTTTWSHFSDNSRTQNIAPAEGLNSRFTYTSPPPATPIESPAIALPPHLVSQGQSPHEKEPSKTCVLRPKRSRRSQKEPRYWCTACQEGFGEKYDWKRHEETYQERFEEFSCNVCENVYFLDKDYQKHHREAHRCTICKGKRQHVDSARRGRPARTGWGCGFCTHFSHDWKERCDHVGRHFESGQTMANWHHSQVIWSLLQRRELFRPFMRLLENKPPTNFAWKPEKTGRADGYPNANVEPKLQDLLEFYTPTQDPIELVHLAFNKNRADVHVDFNKGRVEKALPPLPVSEKDANFPPAPQYPAPPRPPQYAPPPPPPPPSAMQNPLDSIPSWDRLSAIPEDPNLPTRGIDYDDILAQFDEFPSDFLMFE